MPPSRAVVLAVAALLVGVGIGAFGAAAMSREPLPGRLAGRGTLKTLPPGPVDVIAETVELPAGFVSHHEHGGPTLNLVRGGRVEIKDERGATTFGPGGFFFEPAGTPHRIEVVQDARLEVIRLLPPGARATTELAPGG